MITITFIISNSIVFVHTGVKSLINILIIILLLFCVYTYGQRPLIDIRLILSAPHYNFVTRVHCVRRARPRFQYYALVRHFRVIHIPSSSSSCVLSCLSVPGFDKDKIDFKGVIVLTGPSSSISGPTTRRIAIKTGLLYKSISLYDLVVGPLICIRIFLYNVVTYRRMCRQHLYTNPVHSDFGLYSLSNRE